MEAPELQLLAVLAIPHVLYAFIWFLPATFRSLCGRADAVMTFYRLAAALKALQFTAVYLWAVSSAPLNLQAVPPARWALFAVLAAAGQALNGGIYRAIGIKGVYYGFKLGHKIPWVNGFPFNLGISHPQYVGATLSLWGLAALLWAPQERPALLQVCASWTGLYVFTGVIESRF